MKRTVAGGTSPTAVTLWPSMTVEKADEEPTRADSSAGGSSGEVLRWDFSSTNTDTEASPSVNTRWSTGPLDPGRVCAFRTVILNPGGNFSASQTTGSTAPESLGGELSSPLRSHWKPSVEISGLNAASGIREDSVRLANTTCSMTRPRVSTSWG